MAKTARAAMKAKAKRLGSDRSTEKVDSSTFTPPALLNAQAKTGMRPVSRRTYKSGGKVQGECAPIRADRKQRKAGGKAEKADDTPMIDRKINRDLKKANEYREGIKHIGALKNGGRAKKQMGGGMGDDLMPTGAGAGMRTMRPENVRRPSYDEAAVDASMASSGRAGRKVGGKEAAMIKALLKGRTGKAAGGGNNVPLPPKRPPQSEIDAMEAIRRSKEIEKYIKDVPEDLPPPPETRKHGGRTKKQMGGPMGDPRAGGQAMLDSSATVGGVPKELLAFAPSMPSAGMKKHLGLKAGGKAKHTDEAMDKALIKKMVKPEARAKRQDGGGVFSGSGYPGKVPGVVPGGRMARKGGGRAGKNKGTNINIIISPGKGGGPADMQAPMPNMLSMPSQGNPPMLPPGAPPMPPQMGGAPGMPPMPPRPPQGGPPPFKKGGRVYRSYKDMDAGSGSGLGRLEKSEIQSRK
jgi:hypothetical protein